MGFAQAAILYRRYQLVDYLHPIAAYDFILGWFMEKTSFTMVIP